MNKQYIFSEQDSSIEKKSNSIHHFFDGLILLASLTIFSLVLASQPMGIVRTESAKIETSQIEALNESNVISNQLSFGGTAGYDR